MCDTRRHNRHTKSANAKGSSCMEKPKKLSRPALPFKERRAGEGATGKNNCVALWTADRPEPACVAMKAAVALSCTGCARGRTLGKIQHEQHAARGPDQAPPTTTTATTAATTTTTTANQEEQKPEQKQEQERRPEQEHEQPPQQRQQQQQPRPRQHEPPRQQRQQRPPRPGAQLPRPSDRSGGQVWAPQAKITALRHGLQTVRSQSKQPGWRPRRPAAPATHVENH
jgi:outer membrane biosynthesis protein TonB